MNVYEIVRERILEQLEQGIVPWVKPWDMLFPMNWISKKYYRGINRWLLSEYPYWVSAKQATSLGGSVKGLKARINVFFKINEYYQQDDTGAVFKKKYPLLLYNNVFRLDEIGIEFTNPNDKPPITELDTVVTGYKDCPIIETSDRASYNPVEDKIRMPMIGQFESALSYYQTLFHECIHSTGHSSRLDRKIKNIYGDPDYAQEELIAEMGSSFIMAATGHTPNIAQTASYIDGWSKAIKEDTTKRLVVAASSAAQKAADYILGKKEKEESDGS